MKDKKSFFLVDTNILHTVAVGEGVDPLKWKELGDAKKICSVSNEIFQTENIATQKNLPGAL